jgi:hypothetical protein
MDNKLPKIGEFAVVKVGEEQVNPGSELPKMILNLTGAPSKENDSIKLTGTLSSSETKMTGDIGSITATPVKPSSEPEEILNAAFNFLKNKPEDPEADAEAEAELLGELLGDILKSSVEKLTSIDNGIQELLEYFKSEETEEDAADVETKKAEQKQDAERVREQKEQSIDELTERAESLESQNKKESQNKEKQKKEKGRDNSFMQLLHQNLASEMPYLFKDPLREEEEREEKENSGLSSMLGAGAAGGVGAVAARGAVAAAPVVGAGLLAAGTGLSLGYLSDATGVSSFLSQNVLGTSKEEADKAAAQRVQNSTNFMDELLGVERFNKKDGTLDFKKTWGFENPLEVAEDYLFKGEGPLAPTGSKYKERTTDMLKPIPVPKADMLKPTPVPKADITDPAKNLAKVTDEVSKAKNKAMQQSAPVINNTTVNNITNQNATSVTSIHSRGKGALELA